MDRTSPEPEEVGADSPQPSAGSPSSHPSTDSPQSHTSWKRFALFSVPAGVAVGGLLVAMAQGALAASFSVSGQEFKISADSLRGEGFVQYGWLDQTVRQEAVPVAVAGIREAEIVGLCQSVLTEFPIVGKISLRLTAGDQGTPVVAENLVIDMSQMGGDAEFENIEIGRDAGTLDKGPRGAAGFNDLFGMQSDVIVVDGLEQTARAATAGTFRLADLNLGVGLGENECF